MRTATLRTAAILGLLALASDIPAPGALVAQVGNPSPRSIGLADNYTALARGFAAPAWNPAGLGMPTTPGVSFSAMPVIFNAGLGPVTPGDLADYEGQYVPESVRRDWVARIAADGGEQGSIGGDLTYLAMSVGNFAFSASSSLRSRVNMAPDVAEVFFFGNAGFTGSPGDYTLQGSTFDVAGTSTFAVSAGLPLTLTLGPLPDQHFALGATLTYTVGNVLVLGQESQSSLQSDPLAVDLSFPVVHTPFPEDSLGQDLGDVIKNGSGIGLDVGAAWQGGTFSAGLVIRNVFNTFGWDLDKLRYREGSALWTADTSATRFDEASIDEAPPELLDRIDGLYTFSPTIAAGAAARLSPTLTVTGDLRHALDDNLDVGSQTHLGVGAELVVTPALPVRAGLAYISGGYQLAGGLGLQLGPFQLAASGAFRQTELGEDGVGAFGVTFGVP